MKICFVDFYYPPYPGGSEIQAWETTKKMQKLGNEVFVVTRSHKEFPKYHEMNGIKVYRVFSPGDPRIAKVTTSFEIVVLVSTLYSL